MQNPQPLSRFRTIVLVSFLGLVGCRHSPQISVSSAADDGWHKFQGIWTATGARQILSLGSDRRASIASFEGSMMLAGPSRPAPYRRDAVA